MIYNAIINGLNVTSYFSDEDIQNIYIPLLRRLTHMYNEKGSRIIVLMAAPPGAGKTTLSSFLSFLSCKMKDIKPIMAIGMDGFHYYQEYLDTHTVLREGKEVLLAEIKGAPETFDLFKLSKGIERLFNNEIVKWPEYDRHIGNPIENVYTVDEDIVLIEGNYLLLNYPGWKDLKKFADYTIMLRIDEESARNRLITRKMKGKGISFEEASAHVESSDLYNYRNVVNNSMAADILIDFSDKGDLVFDK